MAADALIPPLSKSDAHRALVLADVLSVPLDEVLRGHTELPTDVTVIRDGLLALRAAQADIDCRDGGAPFRFLLAQAAVIPGRLTRFVGTPRLGERPHAPLVAALRAALSTQGLHIAEGQPWPVTVSSPKSLRGPFELVVGGTQSSQYASALLLAAARLAVDVGEVISLSVDGTLVSEGYFELTRSWLRRTGFSVGDGVGELWVSAPSRPVTPFPSIPGDWSSIGYLLALSWASGLPVARMHRGSGHPDEAVVGLLEQVGLRVTDRVRGVAARGLVVDASSCPDSVPTLAALATKLPSPSRFTKVSVLRVKESDRLDATIRLLTGAGLSASVVDDVLTVQPGVVRATVEHDPQQDHRMAMSAAVLARLHGQAVRIEGPDCVAKSFPQFWSEAAKAGVTLG